MPRHAVTAGRAVTVLAAAFVAARCCRRAMRQITFATQLRAMPRVVRAADRARSNDPEGGHCND